MKMKYAVPLLLAGASINTQTLAQSINFTLGGKIEAAACTPNIAREMSHASGGGSATANSVTLPDVVATSLDTAGKVFGNTRIEFKASGCTGNVNHMWVHFTSTNVDSNGRIIPTTGSTEVRFQIFDNSFGGTRIHVGGTGGTQPGANQGTASAFSGSHPANANRVATKYYGFNYYAEAPVTTIGNVSAQVTANFKYY